MGCQCPAVQDVGNAVWQGSGRSSLCGRPAQDPRCMNMGMNSSRIRTDSFLLVVLGLADSQSLYAVSTQRYANPSAPFRIAHFPDRCVGRKREEFPVAPVKYDQGKIGGVAVCRRYWRTKLPQVWRFMVIRMFRRIPCPLRDRMAPGTLHAHAKTPGILVKS